MRTLLSWYVQNFVVNELKMEYTEIYFSKFYMGCRPGDVVVFSERLP